MAGQQQIGVAGGRGATHAVTLKGLTDKESKQTLFMQMLFEGGVLPALPPAVLRYDTHTHTHIRPNMLQCNWYRSLCVRTYLVRVCLCVCVCEGALQSSVRGHKTVAPVCVCVHRALAENSEKLAAADTLLSLHTQAVESSAGALTGTELQLRPGASDADTLRDPTLIPQVCVCVCVCARACSSSPA